MENPRRITDLPLEVLDLIFSNLSQLSNKVRLAQADEKLGKAFAYHSRNNYRRLSPNGRLSPELWVILIMECGPTIEELVCDRRSLAWNDLIAQAVVNYCPNLKLVSICLYRSGRVSAEAFLKQMKNKLTSVTIDQQDHFAATILGAVAEITELKKFSFMGNVDENVYHLQKLVALEKLEIEHIYYRDEPSVNLLQICASQRNLRELSVVKIEIMPFEENNSTVWASLESLTLNKCIISFELPDCPKLKYLEIQYPRCHMEDYILKFILKNGSNMHTLYERCYPSINADGFLQLLRSCPKLRYLDTPMEYIKLYLAYVNNIIEILRENEVTSEDPLELVVFRRIKWKWMRRLLLKAPNSDLIDLYEGTE
ncbi:uncharacterized protein LOC128257326 isoform X1 [Drosophila gunungcola]|uniref:uncharacterized protein LOC128257326 isoform X1 n=1 Tax=Drosophila gunungcola TaxID=103775 RepID=UPI0022E11124|nr:uncharacterized protein LOC128257326 isoform X1 [Drosophila gunungcola]